MPGGRATIRYWPDPSLTADRTFSISTGLAASTVTPGKIPPDVSLTTPVMAACASTTDGRSRRTDSTTNEDMMNPRIALFLLLSDDTRWPDYSTGCTAA